MEEQTVVASNNSADNPINFKFCVTEEYFLSSFKTFRYGNPGLKLGVFLSPFLFPAITAEIYSLLNSSNHTLAIIICGFVTLIFAILFVSRIIFTRSITRKIKSSPPELLITECSASEQGLIYKNQSGESHNEWKKYYRVIESSDAYLIVSKINKNIYHSIPKSSFSKPEDEQAFHNLLARKVKVWSKVNTNDSILQFFSRRERIVLIAELLFLLWISISMYQTLLGL